MAKKTKGFDVVLEAARPLPDVESSTTWGTSALKVRGKLLACQAIHKSAEPNSIVVKIGMDQRAELIAAEPDVYYITDHYENYPTVLVRLSRINGDALRCATCSAWPGGLRTRRRRSDGSVDTGCAPGHHLP